MYFSVVCVCVCVCMCVRAPEILEVADAFYPLFQELAVSVECCLKSSATAQDCLQLNWRPRILEQY